MLLVISYITIVICMIGFMITNIMIETLETSGFFLLLFIKLH